MTCRPCPPFPLQLILFVVLASVSRAEPGPFVPQAITIPSVPSPDAWTGDATASATPDGPGVRIPAGGHIQRTFELSATEETDQPTWLWFAANVWGTDVAHDVPGELTLYVRNASTKADVAQTKTRVFQAAPVVSWSLYTGAAVAPNNGRVASRATDGDLSNEWVSTPTRPDDLYFDLVLPDARVVKGIRYLPRPNGNTTGQVYDYEVLALGQEERWESLAKGSWPDGGGWKVATFAEPRLARRVRLKAIRTGNLPAKPSQIAIAAAEIEPIFDPDISSIGRSPWPSRAEPFVAVPAADLTPLRGQRVVVEITNTGACPVLVGTVCIAEVPTRTPERRFNVRHSEYIDLNAIGVTGYTREGWSALQVHDIAKGLPAAAAGLAPGELITAVGGMRLPSPRLEATRYPRDREWLERHHEPFVARLFLETIRKGRGHLEFETWNPVDGRQTTRRVAVGPADAQAWEGFPLRGPKADELYAELIDRIARDQRADGSWGSMPASMAEAFGLMALLGTRDARRADAIHRAAEYLLAQPAAGGSSRYLGLWEIAFRTMALGEYALATRDPRAVAWLDQTCNALVQGAHVNSRHYLAFGHDRRVLPYGTSGLVAPLSHIVVGDSLARRAGIETAVARTFDPYIRAGWAAKQPVGRQSQGYGSPASGGDADQAWCRSGLIALNYHLRGDNADIKDGLVAFMGEHHGFMRRSHGYGNPGAALGLMGLAGSSPATFRKVMAEWAPMFAMQWVPGAGLRHVESQITNTFAKTPDASAAVFGYSMAVVLSARQAGLHVTGASDRGWLPPSPAAKPQARPAVAEGDPAADWEVIAADCGFPTLIHGVDDVVALSVERARYAFDGKASTWLRTNNGIHDDDAAERTWSVTIRHRDPNSSPPRLAGWEFPPAPAERSGVDDSAKTVRIEARDDGASWKVLHEANIPGDGRVVLAKPLSSRHVRFTFTSRSGSLLILPDVGFIPAPDTSSP